MECGATEMLHQTMPGNLVIRNNGVTIKLFSDGDSFIKVYTECSFFFSLFRNHYLIDYNKCNKIISLVYILEMVQCYTVVNDSHIGVRFGTSE